MDDDRPSLPSAGQIDAGATVNWAEPFVQPEPSDHTPEADPASAMKAIGFPDHEIAETSAWSRGTLPPVLDAVDRQHMQEAAAELRHLWGADYEKNIESINRYVETLPGGAGKFLAAARGEGGRAIGNDPAAMQRLLGAAQARGTQIPTGDAHRELAAIEARIGSKQWYADTNMQARYRELLVLTGKAS